MADIFSMAAEVRLVGVNDIKGYTRLSGNTV